MIINGYEIQETIIIDGHQWLMANERINGQWTNTYKHSSIVNGYVYI